MRTRSSSMRRRRRWRRSASSGRWLASSMRTRSTVDVNLRAEAAAEVLSVSADAEVVVAARPPRLRDEVERASGRRDRDRVGGAKLTQLDGKKLEQVNVCGARCRWLAESRRSPRSRRQRPISRPPRPSRQEGQPRPLGSAWYCDGVSADRTRALGSRGRRSARRPLRRRCPSCGGRVRRGFLDCQVRGRPPRPGGGRAPRRSTAWIRTFGSAAPADRDAPRAVAASDPLRSAPR